jgi:hypothetical protein
VQVDPTPNTSRDREKRGRLHPEHTAKDLLPLRRAPAVSHCYLYWVPVSSWPIPTGERAWLLQFLGGLHALVKSETTLRGEFFLDYQTAGHVHRPFLKNALELLPFLGMARRPGAPIPEPPTADELKKAAAGDGEFDMSQHTPTSCYWFLNQDLERLLPLFFGYGGASMMYLAPDPNATPPEIPYLDEIKEIFPEMPYSKLEAMNSAAASMSDAFLKKSKDLFGVGLEEEPVYEGLPFILPLLQTSDFTGQPQEVWETWYQLFELHWRESPPDRGVFLASRLDLEDKIVELLQQMSEAGQVYPVGR